MKLAAWLREVGREKERRLFKEGLRGKFFSSCWWIGYWGWGKETPRDSHIYVGGGPFHTAVWMKVPFAGVVVLIYITAWWWHSRQLCICWYFSQRKEFWKSLGVGWDGWRQLPVWWWQYLIWTVFTMFKWRCQIGGYCMFGYHRRVGLWYNFSIVSYIHINICMYILHHH